MTVRNEDVNLEDEYEEEQEPTPYENQYRQSLDEPDDDEVEDPIDMATPKPKKKGLVDRKDGNADATHDYKKRYGDLKKHYQPSSTIDTTWSSSNGMDIFFLATLVDALKEHDASRSW